MEIPGVEGISTRSGELMDFPATSERPRPTDAELVTWTADFEATAADRRIAEHRTRVAKLMASSDPQTKLLLAVILELVDEIRAIKAGTPLPSRTVPQLFEAVAARIAAGQVDG